VTGYNHTQGINSTRCAHAAIRDTVNFTLIGPNVTTFELFSFQAQPGSTFKAHIEDDAAHALSVTGIIETPPNDNGGNGRGGHPPLSLAGRRPTLSTYNVKVQLVTPAEPLDDYLATLVIAFANGSDVTRVPFDWPTGKIVAKLLSSPSPVAPGNRVIFPIGLRSLAGRATNVTLGNSDPQSGPPQSIFGVPNVTAFVPRRGSATINLVANVGRNISPGPYDFPVFQSDFDDATYRLSDVAIAKP
jgi:hypothetical protein